MTCGNASVDEGQDGGRFGTIEGQTETAPAGARTPVDPGPRHENPVGGIVTESQSIRITWPCATCDEPIADGQGFVGIPIADLAAYGNGSTLIWRPEHRACADTLDVYGLSVEDLRTHAQLSRWTAHLMEKNWFAQSTWDGVLRHALEEVAA